MFTLNLQKRTPAKKPKVTLGESSRHHDKKVAVDRIKKAIEADDKTDFERSLESFYKHFESSKIGAILHRLSLDEADNTVLHVATRRIGICAENMLVKTCDLAPFLMGKTNKYGDTVWHILARNKQSGVQLFDTFDAIRRQWMSKFTQNCKTVSVNGVPGTKEDLSLRGVNVYGNTALHEALLCKNNIMARKLFYADRDSCFLLNGEGKMPLILALGLYDDANLFKSMFKHAIITDDEIINTQRHMLCRTAVLNGHKGDVINLITNGKEEVHPPLVPTRIAEALDLDDARHIISLPNHPSPSRYISARNNHSIDTVTPSWIHSLWPAAKAAMQNNNKMIASLKNDLITWLGEIAPRDKLHDIKSLILQPDCCHLDPIVMMNRLKFFSIVLFCLTFFTKSISSTQPKFPLFFAVNKLVWFISCFGTLILTFLENSDNVFDVTSKPLVLYLKIVRFMVLLEITIGFFIMAYEFHLYTLLVTFLEWSYKYLL